MNQSYPWYIADWRESETRIRLSLAERALYRELIDYCYLEGSIPTDPMQLSRIAGCTVAEIKKCFPAVESLFYLKGERLYHAKVDEVRAKLEAYHEQKRHAGAASGRTRRKRSLERSLNGRSNETLTEDEPSPAPAPAPAPSPAPAPFPIRASRDPTSTTIERMTASEYPLFTAAITSEFPGTDDRLLYRILHSASQAYTNISDPKCQADDAFLADAVREARRQNPKQYNAVLYEQTVPRIVKAWASNGKHAPPIQKSKLALMMDQIRLEE